ncbi:hypothetical protein ARMGADRAFT_1075926 [Armillaria gallica]|uniref:Uncharacterized protein n=1 Tax=Armillaria gallica TaxID=47427 RepID=A0A2H3DQD8_ARMGA|nr:hypothetical protein ARMGADRAFT_1075926 [Armillaria gallica]
MDIVKEIFESLYYRTDKWTREPDYATLAACSRTQRSWYPPAQSLLFRHIPKGVRPVRLFDDIRILDIILTPESIPDLAFLLTHYPRLYELGLSAQGVFTVPPSVPSANIRALHLVECSVQSPILYNLIKRRCVVDSSEPAWSSSEPRLTDIAALSESGRGDVRAAAGRRKEYLARRQAKGETIDRELTPHYPERKRQSHTLRKNLHRMPSRY